MAAAASTSFAVEAGVKSCLCGNTQQQSPGLVPRIRPGGHKCRICRTKPRFMMRSQRSLDLQAQENPSPIRVANTTEVEQPRRRARSAERYEGMRVNTGDQPQPSLELYFVRAPSRPLPSPMLSVVSSRGQDDGDGARSPPPDYSPSSLGRLHPASMLVSPASPPPSYEEAERTKALSPPSYEESVSPQVSWPQDRRNQQREEQAMALQQLAATAASFQTTQIQQHACSCSKCQASSSASSRIQNRIPTAELRVALPPEAAGGTSTTQYLRAPGAGALSASSHDQCSCYKCQSRYGSSYNDPLRDNDVLLTLETQTAMQGVLTDGVALCSLV